MARLLQHPLAYSWRSLSTCDGATAAVALTLYWSARRAARARPAWLSSFVFFFLFASISKSVSLCCFLSLRICLLALSAALSAGSLSLPALSASLSAPVSRSLCVVLRRSITFYIAAVDRIRPRPRFGLSSPLWAPSPFCAFSVSFISEHCNGQKSPSK